MAITFIQNVQLLNEQGELIQSTITIEDGKVVEI